MENIEELILFYLPLGIVGIWRWGTWLIRKLISWFYQPNRVDFRTTVSIVTPVYNEDPEVLRTAFKSWQANNPSEIIAVIDYTDKTSISIFEEFSRQFQNVKLIITEKLGKRPALADGIKAASSEIVALVDSDVLWTESLLAEALRPFSEPEVAGVGTRQNVWIKENLAQRLYDIQLDTRYHDEMMPAAVAGSTFTCLSGRTALYRRKVLLPLLDKLVGETFWGKQCVGGDDKRLTYLLEAAGYKTRYQHSASVYTSGLPTMKALIRQRTRWSRNSWRADLRALWQGWAWKHPFLAFLLLDRSISNFTLLLSPLYFIASLVFQLWIPAIVLIVWWLISRGIRIMPNLLRTPGNIRLIPTYVIFNFGMAVIRIYALLTLNQQDWLTRGHKPVPNTFGLTLARVATLAILALLGVAVYVSRFR